MNSHKHLADLRFKRRKLHTQLNRMITSKLPLALPPHSADPTVYAIGIRQFAQIYFAFESLWHDIRQAVAYKGENYDMSRYHPMVAEHGVNQFNRFGFMINKLKFLSGILPVELERSYRLRSDLLALERSAVCKLDLNCFISTLPKTEQFITRIHERVRHKPHVLIAYAWIMYMAIFSGGRWIRAQLLSVGEDFWLAGDSKHSSQAKPKEAQTSRENCLQDSVPGLHFLSFGGIDDGELLKATFKERLLEAESILSVKERADIIEEAREIFKFNIAIVEELDDFISSFRSKQCKNGHLGNFSFTTRRFIRQTRSYLTRSELQISIAIIVILVGVIWHIYK